MTDIPLEHLVGKTIISVERDGYNTSMRLDLDDGSSLYLSAGSDGMHNDRWHTVEYKIKKPENG